MMFPHAGVAVNRAERHSRYEPSETAVDENDTKTFELDETDYIPHYQRVFISGEESSSVSVLPR